MHLKEATCTVLCFVDRFVRWAEPYGILLAMFGIFWGVWEFRVEREDRRIDDVNRALALFAENAGRHETLEVLLRNDVDLVGLVAGDAYLRRADLEAVNLSDAVLIGADLRQANLREATLSGADLDDANLSGADLSDADLTRADLGDANLDSADLTLADLRVTNLTRADLTYAVLTGAQVSDANLTGANFTGADLTDVNFFRAILCETTMPDSSTCNRDCKPAGACPSLQGQARK